MKHIHRTFRAWLVCMLAMLAALPASAVVTPDQLEFTEVEGGYSVKAKSDTKLGGTLVIPETYNGKPVVEIGERAFEDCSDLGSVTIPGSVTTIGEWAFGGCSGLTSVSIPASVTTIGKRALSGSKLKKIEVDETNPSYCAIEGVLYNKSQDTLLCCPGGFEGAFITPNAVKTIEDDAFSGCSGLISVTIPDGVMTIGDAAFAQCN